MMLLKRPPAKVYTKHDDIYNIVYFRHSKVTCTDDSRGDMGCTLGWFLQEMAGNGHCFSYTNSNRAKCTGTASALAGI